MRHFILGLALALVPVSALADDPACPTTAQYYPWNTQGKTYSCICPANHARNQIWGTGIYSNDSDLCTAAQHAGLIDADVGGDIQYKVLPGQNVLYGSVNNHLGSKQYSGYYNKSSASITFPLSPITQPTAPVVPADCPWTPSWTGAGNSFTCYCDSFVNKGGVSGDQSGFSVDSKTCNVARWLGLTELVPSPSGFYGGGYFYSGYYYGGAVVTYTDAFPYYVNFPAGGVENGITSTAEQNGFHGIQMSH
jgi:hypothetical protein